jgi:outer membrane cobalamin receptor
VGAVTGSRPFSRRRRALRATAAGVFALALAGRARSDEPAPVAASDSAVAFTIAPTAAPDSTAAPAAAPDSAVAPAAPLERRVPPIVVHGQRPTPRARIETTAGSATVVDVAPLQDRVATAAEVLERIPGLHVNDYGSLGSFSTVSIRGSTSGQVNVYLDGVPLSRSALGVVNLADLPFSSLDRVEVYRGFTPADLPGAGVGGAINLVSRSLPPTGPFRHRHRFVAGGGSFGTRRLGSSHEIAAHGFSALLVTDKLESSGDFVFWSDGGTPLNHGDDAAVVRRNNWIRNDEWLLRVSGALPGGATIRASNQWVRRVRGVPGSSELSEIANGGAQWNLSAVEAQAPRLGHGRLALLGRLTSEWRRDLFYDPQSQIGLGAQNIRDVTRTWTAHAGARWLAPVLQHVAFACDARREEFQPFRPGAGPEQRRRVLEAALEERTTVLGRLTLEAGLRAAREQDDFNGVVRNAYSLRPATGGERTFTEPRAGARLRLAPGVHVRASWNRSHRTPSFLELFGDNGAVAGSTELRVEHGTNRDLGVQFEAVRRNLSGRLDVTHFDNRAQDLITFVTQSQNTLVARNIGATRVRGEEWIWQLQDAGPAHRWSLDGGFTRLDAKDLGVDLTWYAGKSLPVRPARELHQRIAVRAAAFEFGYEYDYVGRNYLDRFNTKTVARRDLHGLDVRWTVHRAAVQCGVRNLTNDRAADVAGFPLPGRSVFFTTSYRI